MAVHKIRYIAVCLSLLAMSIGVSGCAVESLPYPQLETDNRLKTPVLSRSQQNAVIKALTVEQTEHKSAAIEQIENKQPGSLPYPQRDTTNQWNTNALSREQQSEIIKALTAEQNEHKSAAIEQIENKQ